MKTMKTLIFSFFLILFISCEEKETNNTYDFKVLGIEKIVIDGNTEITLSGEGMPDKTSTAYAIVSVDNGTPVRNYGLTVWKHFSGETNFNVVSKYADISVAIEKKAESGYYNVIVSRKGFNEQLIYKIGFLNPSI
jgi:hypothetical protein